MIKILELLFLLCLTTIVGVLCYYKGFSDGCYKKINKKLPVPKKGNGEFSELIDPEFEELMRFDGKDKG